MKKEIYLDGLRGLAAFVVVIYHYITAFYPALYTGNINNGRTNSGIEVFIANSPFNLLYDGSVSVCIFFVLSGYVLTCKFFKYNDTELIVSSIARRYFRLMIPVLFSISVAYMLLKLGLYYNVPASQITSSEWLKNFYNFTPNILEMVRQGIVGVIFEQSTSYNPTLWTMYYEFYGSIIVLLLAFIASKTKNRYILYMAALLISLNTKFLPFILGLILSDLYNTKVDIIKKHNIKCINISILFIGLFLLSYPPTVSIENTIYKFMSINYFKDISYFYHSLGSFLIMIVVLNLGALKAMFSRKIFQFLGSISFSMYIIHFLVLNSLSSYIFIQLSPFFKYYQVFLITFIISISLIILSSYFIYKYIDLSGIRFSKFLYKKCFIKAVNAIKLRNVRIKS